MRQDIIKEKSCPYSTI